MAISVGSVSVRVVPDAQRFTRDLEGQIGGTARKLGQRLGQDLAKDIDKPIVDKVRNAVSSVASDQGKTVGSRIGKEIGDGIAKGMGDGAKAGGKQVEGQGKDSGGAFAREFQKAVEKAMTSLPSKQTVALGVDDKNTTAAIEKLRERLSALHDKNVGVDINGDEAIAQLKAIEAEANRLARSSPTIKVNVKTDLDTLTNDLARFRARAGAEGDAAGQNFGGSFERKIRASLSNAMSALPELKINADSSPVDRAISDARAKLAALRDAQVVINGDSSDFLASFAQVRADLAELNGSTATANIRADAGEALRQMGEVEAFLRKIDGQTATANVNVDDNGSSYVVDTNVSRLLNRLMLFGSAATGIAALVGPLLAVGAAAGVAAAALGAGILAFGGIGDAVKALNDEQTKAGTDASKNAKKQVQSANQVASAQDRLSSAQRNVGTVQQNVADQAISSAVRVRDADEKVSDARAKAAQAAKQAADGVITAEQRLATVQRDTAERALSDAQAVASARQAAADAAVQAQRRIQQADQSVLRAEETLQDAQKASTTAQKALTAARKEATRQLLDMQDSVTDNALAQRGAALDLIEARQELNKTNADPSSTGIERARAQLSFDQALQQTKELSRAGKELGQDYASASAAGVEGSDQVTQAQDQVVSATRGVRDAQTALGQAQQEATDARVQGARDVSKANQDLADAQRRQANDAISSQEQIRDALKAVSDAQAAQTQTAIDNARSIRDAEQSAADARREQATQARQGQEQIANANQQVVDAQRQLQNAYASAGDEGSAAADKVAQAFKDLSPVQADFARFLFSLKGQYLELRNAAADGFLPGAKGAIEALLTRFTDFKQVIGQFGAAGGQAVKQIGEQMASPYFTQFWHNMGDLSGPIMGGLADTVGRVAKATADWVTELLPLSGIGLDALNRTADFFSQFATSLPGIARPLTFAFQDMLGDLTPLGPAVAALAELFAGLGRVLSSLIGGALIALTPILSAVAGALRVIAAVLEAIPGPLIAVLTALLALRVAKTIFGDFRAAVNYTRKAYPAFGKDTRLAARETVGLGSALGGAGSQAEAAAKAFRKGGTDAAASQRQHLLLRTSVRDVGAAFDFVRDTTDKARAAYSRGAKDAERVQAAFDSMGRGVGRTVDSTISGASAVRNGLRTFADSADSAAVRTGQSFTRMASSISTSLRNVRADAARGVSLGKLDTQSAKPDTTLDMGDYTKAESIVTRVTRAFTRATTASEGWAASARRGFATVRDTVTSFGTAVGAGFDRLRIGAAQGEGALVRVKQAFTEGGLSGAATEARRTFVAAADGITTAARSFVADGVRAFTVGREGIASLGAAAQNAARTFTVSKNGIVTDVRETGGELVRMSDAGNSMGARLGRQFANLSDKVFPGFRQSAVALGREAQGAFLNASSAINDVRNRAAASSTETQSVLGRMAASFRTTRDVFVAGADGITRGFQSAGEKGLLPFQANAERVFSAVSRASQTASRFVAGVNGIERESATASTSLIRMGQATSGAVAPFQSAGDKAEAMGRILGTLGQTISVQSQRIGSSLTDIGTEAESGGSRAGRAFVAMRDGLLEVSKSTAVAVFQTGSLVRTGLAPPAEEAATRMQAAGARIRSDLGLTEARAQLTTGNIGGALRTVGAGAFEVLRTQLRGAGDDAEAQGGRIRGALSGAFSGVGALATTAVASTRASLATIPAAAGEAFRSLGDRAGAAVSAAGGHIARFTGMISGLTRAGASVAASGIGGLYQAIGGSMGVAIGIAGVAFNALLGFFQRADERAQQARQSAVQYADELRKSNGVITDHIRSQVQQQSATDGVTQAAAKLGITQQQLNDAVLNGGPAFDALKQSLFDNGLGSADLGKQWSSLMYIIGIGSDPTIAAADNLQKLRDSVQGAKDLAQQLPNALNDARDAISAQGQAAQSTVTNNQTWTTAIKNLGDESKTSDDKVSGLSNALLGMSDPAAKARDAARDTAAAFRELPGEIDKAKGSIDAHTGAIDVNSQAGSDLSKTLDDLRQAYGTTYGAEFQKAITSGHDFQESSKIAADAASGIRDRLYEVGKNAGLTTQQIDGIVKEFGLVPKDVPIDMHLTDTAKLNADIQNVIDRLKTTPKDVPINVRINTDAQRVLYNLGFQIETLPDGSVNIIAHDETAKATLNGLVAFGSALQTNPKIAADPAQFDAILLQKINEARAQTGLPALSARDDEFKVILANALQLANTASGIPGLGLDPNKPGGFNPTFADRLNAIRTANPTLFVKGNFDDVNRQLHDIATQVITLPVATNPPILPPGTPPLFNQPTIRHAIGGIDHIVGMAAGGVRAMAAGVATTVAPNTPTLIGDRKKDDEAYIPINKSPRSIAILTQTAAEMGFKLMPMAAGGILGAVGMAAGGTSAKDPATGAAAPTVDPDQQQAAASATTALNSALAGQASVLGTLSPALAATQAMTDAQQVATTNLATANTGLLTPALQWLVAGGITPVVAAMTTTLFPTLANYQLQTGTNSVLANQALQLAQSQTALQSNMLATTTAADTATMAATTTGMSLQNQGQLLGLRNGMIFTSNQSNFMRDVMAADHGIMMQAALNSTNFQLGTQNSLRGGMMATLGSAQAWADGNKVQMDRIGGDTGGMVKWTYAFPLTSLVNAWNKLNTDFAINKPIGGMPPLSFATGGHIPGTGSGTEDNVPILASAGEFVVQESIASKTRPFLQAFNAGQPEAIQAAGGFRARGPQKLAGGGDVERIARAKAFAAQQVGKPYVWGAAGPGGFDCSGFMSAVLNAYNGDPNPFHRVGSTGNFPWGGFTPGLTSAFAIGSTGDAGGGIGHMAGTLGGSNIESAGGRGPAIGGPAIGADNALFPIRASLPGAGGTFVSGGQGGGAFDIGSIVAPYFETAKAQAADITKFFPTAPAPIAQGEVNQGIDGAIAKATQDFMATVAVGGGGGGERWRPVVMRALAMLGQPANLADRVVQQIGIESGGNPSIVNTWDVNAKNGVPSGGLLQTIKPTFESNRDPRLPDNMFDPLANIVAAINYVTRKYGGIANIWPKTNGYDSGGIASGPGLLAKMTQQPERVLSPQQTRSFDTLVELISDKDLLKAIQPAADQGPSRTYNVYPRANQSEESIAQAVRRRDAFESRLR